MTISWQLSSCNFPFRVFHFGHLFPRESDSPFRLSRGDNHFCGVLATFPLPVVFQQINLSFSSVDRVSTFFTILETLAAPTFRVEFPRGMTLLSLGL